MQNMARNGFWLAMLSLALLLCTGCGKKITRGMAHSEDAVRPTTALAAPEHFPAIDLPEGDRDATDKGGPFLETFPGGVAGEASMESGPFTGVEEEQISEVDSVDTPIETGPSKNQELSQWGSSYPQARHKAELRTAETGLRDIFFEFDSWRLTEEAKQILAANAAWLKAHRHETLTIEGHCDERGARSYNYALGYKRAMVTHKYLTSLGVPSSQLLVTSYGKDKPTCWEYDEMCFQQNRRAHVVVGVRLASGE